jgi:hypothetical protein
MANMKVTQDPFIGRTLANATDTAPEVLAALTSSSHAFVREAALSNQATPLTAVAAAIPSSLRTEAQVGIARAIASRDDAPTALLEQLLVLVEPSKIDGSRRENWPYEQLVSALLFHRNLSAPVKEAFLSKTKLSKRVRSLATQSPGSPG